MGRSGVRGERSGKMEGTRVGMREGVGGREMRRRRSSAASRGSRAHNSLTYLVDHLVDFLSLRLPLHPPTSSFFSPRNRLSDLLPPLLYSSTSTCPCPWRSPSESPPTSSPPFLSTFFTSSFPASLLPSLLLSFSSSSFTSSVALLPPPLLSISHLVLLPSPLLPLASARPHRLL